MPRPASHATRCGHVRSISVGEHGDATRPARPLATAGAAASTSDASRSPNAGCFSCACTSAVSSAPGRSAPACSSSSKVATLAARAGRSSASSRTSIPATTRSSPTPRRPPTRSATTSCGASSARSPASAGCACSIAAGTAGCSSSASRDFATDEQWTRAYDEIVAFERTLVHRGVDPRQVLAAHQRRGAARPLRGPTGRAAEAVEADRRGLAQPGEEPSATTTPPRTSSPAPITSSPRGISSPPSRSGSAASPCSNGSTSASRPGCGGGASRCLPKHWLERSVCTAARRSIRCGSEHHVGPHRRAPDMKGSTAMKRSSRFTVALAGGAVGLLAAGSAALATTPSSAEPVELSLLDNSIKGGKNERAAIWIEDELIPAFEAEMEAAGTPVEVSFEGQGVDDEDYKTQLALDLGSGEGPDVMSIDGIWVGEFATAEYIRPLDRRRRAGGRGVGRLGPDQRGGPGQRDVRGRSLRDPAGHRRPRHLLQQGDLRRRRPARGLAADDRSKRSSKRRGRSRRRSPTSSRSSSTAAWRWVRRRRCRAPCRCSPPPARRSTTRRPACGPVRTPDDDRDARHLRHRLRRRGARRHRHAAAPGRTRPVVRGLRQRRDRHAHRGRLLLALGRSIPIPSRRCSRWRTATRSSAGR